MHHKSRLSMVLFLFIFGFLLNFSQVKAIGVSPSIIEVNDLANGIVVDKQVFVMRENPKSEEIYTVKVEGDGSKYIKLSSDKITIPKGDGKFPYKFSLNPVGAANGTYKVKLVFDGTVPEASAQSGNNNVAILAGITARINFTITDQQVKKIEISSLRSDEAEVNQSVVLHFRVKNLGNVDAKPDLIKVALTNQLDPTQVFTDEITSENIEFVGPAKDQEISVKLKSSIPQGRYNLKAEFYVGGSIIYTQEISVEIFPSGTLAQKLDVLSFTVTPQKLGVGETVRFSSNVKNSGEIVLEPVFVVKILKDGQQLEFLRSEKQMLVKGEGGTFSLSYRTQELGNYVASSYLEYGVRKTEAKELNFSVEKDNSVRNAIIGGAILLFIILIFVLLVVLIKKHKKKVLAQKNASVIPPGTTVNPVVPIAPVSPVQNSVIQQPVSQPVQTVVPPVATQTEPTPSIVPPTKNDEQNNS
jgi:hypothetical protein